VTGAKIREKLHRLWMQIGTTLTPRQLQHIEFLEERIRFDYRYSRLPSLEPFPCQVVYSAFEL
jgi:hypothetical protein